MAMISQTVQRQLLNAFSLAPLEELRKGVKMQTFINQITEYTRIKDRIQALEDEFNDHECTFAQCVDDPRAGSCECIDMLNEIEFLTESLKNV